MAGIPHLDFYITVVFFAIPLGKNLMIFPKCYQNVTALFPFPVPGSPLSYPPGSPRLFSLLILRDHLLAICREESGDRFFPGIFRTDRRGGLRRDALFSSSCVTSGRSARPWFFLRTSLLSFIPSRLFVSPSSQHKQRYAEYNKDQEGKFA